MPAILRGLVACGWFGIQTWVGGSAIYTILNGVSGDWFQGEPLPVLGGRVFVSHLAVLLGVATVAGVVSALIFRGRDL